MRGETCSLIVGIICLLAFCVEGQTIVYRNGVVASGWTISSDIPSSLQLQVCFPLFSQYFIDVLL